ncbi:hypothetical protein [Altererythrobacter lauratis]|uniref:Uncharacterized protein n=1 Tax=Alteraurantiacibacter lauratis TaxID=2054627 RepID=A0ABV7EDT3_9SPHN
MRISRSANLLLALAGMAACGFAALPAQLQAQAPSSQLASPFRSGPLPAADLTYVDLVELGQAAELVMRVEVRKQSNIRPANAPGLAPGMARLLLEADTQALIAGPGPVGARHSFLVDLPLNERGRRPNLKRETVIVFARRVPNRPGQIQLVGPQAIQPADPLLETRVREVMTQLVQGERPPVITGVKEVMSVPGNLAGESETQIFLETRSGAPVSLSIVRRPGMAPEWGVSWTEIVDQSARPPRAETLQWYALACFLPPELPADAFLQRDPDSRARARADYALVRDRVGPCARSAE